MPKRGAVAHPRRGAPHFRLAEKPRLVKLSCAKLFVFFLERSLTHAGNLALVGQFTEADTADAVVTQVSVGAAAQLAAVVLASGELRRSLLLQDHRFLSHLSLPP